MPELPDVETFRKYLESVALGKRVEEVEVRSPRILDSISVKDFIDTVTGQTFKATKRIGKNLLVELDAGNWLTLHFGMTGFLKFFTNPAEDPGHVRILFKFTDGNLAYDNRRMIGKVGIIDSPLDLVRKKNLGPDALEVNKEAFLQGLSRGKGDIKSLLMDQSFIAGIGNVYADEILFQRGVNPKTKSSSIDTDNGRRMYETMRQVLKTAVERGADVERLPDSFLLPHRDRHGKCPRCGNKFSTLKIGGRTTYFCSTCQP